MIAADRLSAASAAALAAALLTAAGGGISGNQRLSIGVPLLVAGFACACVAAYRAVHPARARSARWIADGLAAMAAIAVVLPPRDHPPTWYAIAYRAIPAAGILVAGLYAGGVRAARRAMWASLALVVALQVVTPVVNPRPFIDVWAWSDTAARALLAGVHPYVVQAADIYRGGFSMGYQNTVYPYMPLTVVTNAPTTWLVGDFRFGLAVCLPATAALLRVAGRRLLVDEALLDAMTLLLVFAPHNTYLVASGYVEPLLGVGVALFVWAMTKRPFGTGAATAFLALPALKQYVVAPPLLFAADSWRRRSWRPLVVGGAVALASVVPFLLWNWRATLDGIVFQVRPSVGFRPDSLSVTALVASLTGIAPWHWLPEIAQVVAGAMAYWWLRDTGAGGLLLASAIAMDASFLLGTQAFTNYYAFVTVLLLAATMFFARRDGSAV
jgi:hypothetical protein